MLFFDSLYLAAFCIFLIGASLTLREISPPYSLWIMVGGVLIDFFATVIPNRGFKSMAIGIGSSAEIVSGIVLGVLVWTIFLAAIFVRIRGNQSFFCTIIALIKLLWFVDLVLFFYGVYNFK